MTDVPSINSKHTIDITIVVPAYNESLRLPIMLKDTSKFLKQMQKSKKLTYEVSYLCYILNLYEIIRGAPIQKVV